MKLLTYVQLRNVHNSTGAGRVARNIVEQLHVMGQDDIRILGDRTDRLTVVPQVGAPWTGYRYADFTLDTSKQQALWLLTDRPRAERWWPDADVIYSTGESYVPTRRMKSAVTLHDAAYFEEGAHVRSLTTLRQAAKWKILHGKLERRVDMFHTVSQFSADRLAHFFPGMRDRLRVVHNGVTDRFFQGPNAAGEAELARLGLAGRQFILLPRGLAYRKNADLVLDAWPKLQALHPDLLLVVSSHNEPDYAARAQALGPSVVLAGFVSDDLLCSLYHAAQLVWYPSLYEGFGIPLVEAMVCGTAVVASDAASIPEVTGDAAMLVDPLSAGAHIEAIDALLRDDGARRRLVDRGLERGKRFTWNAAAVTLRRYLAELA